MAPLPSKRRKLNHDSDEIVSDEEAARNTDEIDDQSSAESEDDAPIAHPKKPLARPNRAHEDDSAIYAGGDYKSTLFKLQVDELLAEVKPNYERRLRGVDEALRTLKGLIDLIEERDAVSVSFGNVLQIIVHQSKCS